MNKKELINTIKENCDYKINEKENGYIRISIFSRDIKLNGFICIHNVYEIKILDNTVWINNEMNFDIENLHNIIIFDY